MTPTTPNARLERCASCGAAFSPEDRFCATCGANRAPSAPDAKAGRRGTWLIVSMSVALLAALGCGLFIYFTAPERRTDTPVGHVTLRGPAPLGIVPGPPVTAFIGTADSLLVSGDRGNTWQSVPSTSAVGAIAIGSNSPPVVYLAGSALWSFDLHQGLTQIPTDLPTASVVALAVAPDNLRHLYAIVKGQGMAGSADGGATWQAAGGGIPTDTNSLTLATTASARFFIGTAQHGIYASEDGQAWTNASGFVNGALPTKNVMAVAFDPRSGDQYVGPSGQATSGALYAATDIGVFKSIDSGISWSSMPFHRATVALAVATDGSHLMLAVDSSGNVYRSTDGGNSWGG